MIQVSCRNFTGRFRQSFNRDRDPLGQEEAYPDGSEQNKDGHQEEDVNIRVPIELLVLGQSIVILTFLIDLRSQLKDLFGPWEQSCNDFILTIRVYAAHASQIRINVEKRFRFVAEA